MTADFDQQHAIVKEFIQCFLSAREGLKKLGVLRSERNLQGDYAEWLVAKRFNLKLSTNTVQKGVDATDKQGRAYQIKARMVKNLTASTSFDFRTPPTKLDYLVCVFFSHALEQLGIARVPYKAVRDLGRPNGSADFRFRWNKSVSEDKRIEKFDWNKSDEQKV